MEIDRIKIANFLSFGPEQVVTLADQGLVFVEGWNRDDPKAQSNGAGKSALLEAIVWCLTGRTVRGIKADDVINRKAGKNCYVELSGNKLGTPWAISRYRKLNRRSGVSFMIGGIDVTAQGDPQATQDHIYRHLQTSFDLFTNTTIFGQGAKWRFTELTDAPQKALLDQILGVEVIVRALAAVKQRRMALMERVESLENKRYKVGTKIEATESAIEDVRTTMEEERKRRLHFLRDELDEIDASINQLKTALAGLPRLRISLSERQKAKIAAEFAREEAERRLQALRDARMESGAAVEVAHQRRITLDQTLDAAVALKPDAQCDHCGSKITARTREAHLESLRADLLLAGKALETARHADTSLRHSLEKQATHARAAVDRRHATDQEVRGLLALIEKVEAHEEEVVQLRERREALEIEIKRLKSAKVKGAMTAKLERKLAALIERQAKLGRLIAARQRELAHYDFWVEGFGNAGVKSHLLDHIVPVLNQRAARFSKHLMEGLVVEFDSESATKKGQVRDKFEVTVTNRYGAAVYAGNSGGERRKVDIVVGRTLQSLEEDRAPCNIAGWDEVFESLDETSCEAVMGMLREEAAVKSSVFVVSHLEWLKPHFPRVLRVTKEGGFSRLEWA